MNERHLTYLASPEWAQALRTELLPWLRRTVDLGDDVLEVGPGPGLTTDLLRDLAAAVTAVEIDASLAAALRERLSGSNVRVRHGDALTLALPPARFSAATAFSMLHHLPSAATQDQLFARLRDLLRPGGLLVGVDTVDAEPIREAHRDDTFVPIEEDTLAARLEAAGFTDLEISRAGEYQIRFRAARSLDDQN